MKIYNYKCDGEKRENTVYILSIKINLIYTVVTFFHFFQG